MAYNKYKSDAITMTGGAVSQINGKNIVDLDLREKLDTDIGNISASVDLANTVASTAGEKAETATAALERLQTALSNVYTKDETSTLISEINGATKVSDLENDLGFITSSALDDYATKSFVSDGFATKESLANYATKDEVSNSTSGIRVSNSSNISLNNDIFKETGIYAISEGINSPTNASDGILTVKKFGDVGYFQVWDDINNNHASRFPKKILDKRCTLVIEDSEGEVYEPSINLETNEAIFNLEGGKSYTASGYLYGKIIIVTNNASTELTLNGVTIESTAQEAIKYIKASGENVSAKSLILNLIGRNYIKYEGTAESNTSAVIFSQGNLKINGTGYLFIDNYGTNHGIKADDFSVYGYPYIHIDNHSGHDAIHVNDNLLIEGGYFNLNNCKDGIGVEGDYCLITNAIFDGENILEDLVDTKNDVVSAFAIDTTIAVTSNLTFGQKINHLSVNTFKSVFSEISLRALIGEPLVQTVNKNQAGDLIVVSTIPYDSINEEYLITDENTTYNDVPVDGIKISGYFGDRQIRISCTGKVKVYSGNSIFTMTERQAILYENDAKKTGVNIKIEPYSFGIFLNDTLQSSDGKYGAIKSKNNLKISGDGAIFCKSNLSDGIDADDIIIEGDGFRSFIGSTTTVGKYGISCKELHIGADPDDYNAGNAGMSYQTVFFNSAYAALNKSGAKGTITVYDNSLGLLVATIANSMTAAGDNGYTDPRGIYCNFESIRKEAQILNIPSRGYIEINTSWKLDDESAANTEEPQQEEEPKVGIREEINRFDFAAIPTKSGDFYVKNSVNSPFTGDSSGLLSVMETNDGFIETWSSANYTGYRKIKDNVNPITEGINNFFINGEYIELSRTKASYGAGDYRIIDEIESDNTTGAKRTIRTVILRFGKTYTLSGALTNIKIKIDTEDSSMPDNIAEAYASISGSNDQTFTLNGITFTVTGKKSVKQAAFMARIVELGIYVPSMVTTIILDNLFMHFNDFIDTSNEDDTGFVEKSEMFIEFTATKGTGIVKLKEGTTSYLTRTMKSNMTPKNNSRALIFSKGEYLADSSSETYETDKLSNSKLIIEGPGRLVLNDNLGGHGLKSQGYLIIKDNPEIYCNVYHDFAHGKLGLSIANGKFYIAGCHDVLGTNTITSDNDIGEMRLYGGNFYIENCAETVVQADNAIIYPGVTFEYKNVGEGLWLETRNAGSIANGSIKRLTDGTGYYMVSYKASGEISGFFVLRDTNKFVAYSVKKSLGKTLPFMTNSVLTTSLYTTEAAIAEVCDGTESVNNYKGIIIYDGVVTTLITGGVYNESLRNTPHNGNELISPTVNATIGENEVGIDPEMLISSYGTEHAETYAEAFNITNINFNNRGSIGYTEDSAHAAFWYTGSSFNYSGENVTGGAWNIGYTEGAHSEFENKNSLELEHIKSMIIPPKSVYVAVKKGSTMLTTTDAIVKNTIQNVNVNLIDVPFYTGAETKYGGIKVSNENTFSTKTGIIPVITLRVGEKVRIYGIMNPDNSTNIDLKWTIAGEYCIIGRTKSDDTKYCDVLGLQEGEDDIIITAKALDKNYASLSMKVHFVVVNREAGYTIENIPDEPTGKKLSEFINDTNYVTTNYHDSTKANLTVVNALKAQIALLESVLNQFNLSGCRLIPSPTDTELVTSADAVKSVSVEGDEITIRANLANIVEYPSSVPSQGTHKWLGLEISTGLDSILGVNYGSYALTQGDADEAASVGCSAGSFVLYVKAEELVTSPIEFTISKLLYRPTKIKVKVIDTSVAE